MLTAYKTLKATKYEVSFVPNRPPLPAIFTSFISLATPTRGLIRHPLPLTSLSKNPPTDPNSACTAVRVYGNGKRNKTDLLKRVRRRLNVK
jgi:hypothetical protein